MFFSWYARNRHFKQKSNWSGQIFPILLICLAGLLVAVMVSIRIGENAKARTFASNAADAGSLTTASYQAGAFNKLVARNKRTANDNNDNFYYYMVQVPENKYQYYKSMRYYFDYPREPIEMKARYKILYALGNSYLAEAQLHIQEVLILLAAALEDIQKPIVNCKPAASDFGAADNRAARVELEKARKCIGAFHVLTHYMYYITAFFKDKQTKNFCEANEFMHGEDGVSGAWKKSREAGQTYAFNNSGIMSMLSEKLGDDFNYQLGTDALFGGPTATYSWQDPNDPTKSCFVSATVELPNILTYKLKHTKWNWPKEHVFILVPFKECCNISSYPVTEDNDPPLWPPVWEDEGSPPFDIKSSKVLYDELEAVEACLETLAWWGDYIVDQIRQGLACCNCECDGSGPPCDGSCTTYDDLGNGMSYSKTRHCDPAPYYDEARRVQGLLIGWEQCVINGLGLICCASSVDMLTIDNLRIWNDLIWNNVWAEKTDHFPAIKNCPEVKAYRDGETKFRGMMVMNIHDVILDGDGKWQTKCTVTASCSGSTTTHNSTSKFWGEDGGRGENIGKFIDKYYPEIILTD